VCARIGCSSMSPGGLILLNAGIRLAYGVIVALWPSASANTRLPLAPDTDRLPEARLFVRGFSAHQIGVGLVGLASLRRKELQPAAAALAGAVDALDIASAVVEARARGRWDEDLVGGAIFSGAGLATALAAWRAK
jgi:hypothetical protein